MKTIHPDSVVGQLIYEYEEWARLLVFLKQENIFCKSRLAEVVNAVDDNELVEEAEKFNEDFLSQDNILVFLTEELKTYNKLLQKDWYGDDEFLKNLLRHQKKLRKDIEKTEEIFSGTKKNFSGFLNSLL